MLEWVVISNPLVHLNKEILGRQTVLLRVPPPATIPKPRDAGGRAPGSSLGPWGSSLSPSLLSDTESGPALVSSR